MTTDYGRGGGYDYQWLLSFYLYTFLKEEDYLLNKYKKYPGKDFSLFIQKMNDFKEKCVIKYGNEFNFKFEILVEGEEECLDDITFISDVDGQSFDNNIFIQVKTKGGSENSTISTSDGIYKAVSNFISNINFQKDKLNGNILFFIFTNKDLTRPLLKRIDSKSTKLYIDFSNYIMGVGKNNFYPDKQLKNLYKTENSDLITSILNSEDVIIDRYLKIYSEDYLLKLITLINDLKIIFNNINIITKVDHDILEFELESFYGETVFLRELRRISKLCFRGEEIKSGTPEFEKYEKYKYTYFLPQDGGKFIYQIDSICKGKFI